MAQSREVGLKSKSVIILVVLVVTILNINSVNCASFSNINDESDGSTESQIVYNNYNTSDKITEEQNNNKTSEIEFEIINEIVYQNETEDDTHHILDLRKTKNKKINENTKNDSDRNMIKESNEDKIQEKNEISTNSDDLETIATSTEDVLDSILNVNDAARYSDDEIWTKFRWLMELFDQHKFDLNNLKDVSKNCTEDMLVYLKALRRGETWAAKMYDASGHYNGQFFFGSNYWLGSKGLCKELQYNITPPFAQGINHHLLKTPPFATGFSTAVIRVKVGFYTPQVRTIFLGVCMPSACSAGDISAILESDSRKAEILANDKMAALRKRNGGHNDITSSQDNEDSDDAISVMVAKVRPVPGPYVIWDDYKFYIVCGVAIFTLLVIAVATFYEAYVNFKNEQRVLNKIKLAAENDSTFVENNNKIRIDRDIKQIITGKHDKGTVNDGNGHVRSDNGLLRGENRINGGNNGHARVDGELFKTNNGLDRVDGRVDNGHVRVDGGFSRTDVGFPRADNGLARNKRINAFDSNGKASGGNIIGDETNARSGGVPDIEKRKILDKKYGTSIPSQILLCFSALTNTGKIMKTDDGGSDAINCIHGLRFLSLGWVIMVHTYLQMFSVADNKTLRVITERNFFYQTVGNASYSVDTFFFISGLLLTYLYQKALETRRRNLTKKYEKLRLEQTPSTANHFVNQQTNGNRLKITPNSQYESATINNSYFPNSNNEQQIHQLNKAMFKRQTCAKEIKESIEEFFTLLFNRFVRLTPAYLFAIGLNLLATKYAYNNSVFEPIIQEHKNCDVYWWRNILYINNFYPGDEMCMKWSWYMANDTQFYVIGIILMILSKRHAKLSLVTIGVLMISSWLTTGYVSISNNYKAKIQLPFELFDQIYVKPWSRLGPYLVGMLTGWYLWRWNGRIYLPTWVLFIGWPSALALMAALIYGMKDGYLDLWPTAFYISVGHTAWSVSVAWVVICCVAHRGGIISRILSYRGAFPLSRLAYCAYLVHVIIMIYTSYSSDGPVHLHNGVVLIMYAGLCVMSYLLSFVMSLCFEVPIVRMLKLMGPVKKKNV